MTVEVSRRHYRRSAAGVALSPGDNSPSTDPASFDASPLTASSSPLLLRLSQRHECQRRKPASSSLSPSSSRLLSPFVAMSLVMLLIAAVFTTASNADQTGDGQQHEVFKEERSMVTISPFFSCPQGCYCVYTLMFCQNINIIPSSISPATKFIAISGSQFLNPVLARSNFSNGYQNVEDIAIQYTNLAVITNRAFDNLRRVRYISLDHNQLRSLPSSMLRIFARAKFVSLFANQLNCNRKLAWLYEVYRSNPDKFGAGCMDYDCKKISQVRCVSPPNFANLDFVNITFGQYQQMQIAP